MNNTEEKTTVGEWLLFIVYYLAVVASCGVFVYACFDGVIEFYDNLLVETQTLQWLAYLLGVILCILIGIASTVATCIYLYPVVRAIKILFTAKLDV